MIVIVHPKPLKTKATKALKTGPKNVRVINFENKGFDKIYVSSIFCYQDVTMQLIEPLQTDENIPVSAIKLQVFEIKY